MIVFPSARLGSHENFPMDTKWVETSNKKAAVKVKLPLLYIVLVKKRFNCVVII